MNQKDATREYFNGIPKEYYHRAMSPSSLECLRIILDMIPDGKGLDILDMGCGPGSMTEMLAKNHHVVGVDISEKMVDFAKRNSNSDAVYMAGDAETFDSNRKFDVAISKGMFEYLESDDEAMGNIHRLLKPNGRLIAEFRHAGFRHGDPNYVDPYPTRRRAHDPDSLKFTAEKLGFKLTDVKFYHFHKDLKISDAASAFVALFLKNQNMSSGE